MIIIQHAEKKFASRINCCFAMFFFVRLFIRRICRDRVAKCTNMCGEFNVQLFAFTAR